jgi:hypothetical protein
VNVNVALSIRKAPHIPRCRVQVQCMRHEAEPLVHPDFRSKGGTGGVTVVLEQARSRTDSYHLSVYITSTRAKISSNCGGEFDTQSNANNQSPDIPFCLI